VRGTLLAFSQPASASSYALPIRSTKKKISIHHPQ
jgi:hypothetical protein